MKKEFFMKNREKAVSDMEDFSVLVFFAGSVPSTESSCRYSVNKNFYYVTGLEIEGQIVVIKKKRM